MKACYRDFSITLGSSRVFLWISESFSCLGSFSLMREKRHVFFQDLIHRQNYYFIAAHCTGGGGGYVNSNGNEFHE